MRAFQLRFFAPTDAARRRSEIGGRAGCGSDAIAAAAAANSFIARIAEGNGGMHARIRSSRSLARSVPAQGEGSFAPGEFRYLEG